MFKEKSWLHKIRATESTAILFGVKIFNVEWKNTGRKAVIKNDCESIIYSACINGENFEFLCDEYSNGVYDFYVYEY